MKKWKKIKKEVNLHQTPFTKTAFHILLQHVLQYICTYTRRTYASFFLFATWCICVYNQKPNERRMRKKNRKERPNLRNCARLAPTITRYYFYRDATSFFICVLYIYTSTTPASFFFIFFFSFLRKNVRNNVNCSGQIYSHSLIFPFKTVRLGFIKIWIFRTLQKKTRTGLHSTD